jgi:hypothetical protein
VEELSEGKLTPQEAINQHRRLQKLREKKSLQGISADPSLLEIENIETQLFGSEEEPGHIFNLLETEKIQGATKELLRELAHFHHWTIGDIQESAGLAIEQVYTNLKFKCYAWRQTIWPRLDTEDQRQVEKIRQRLEGVHTPDDLSNETSSEVPDLVDKILSLDYVATK